MLIVVDSIMVMMLNLEARGYFGSQRKKLTQVAGIRAPRKTRVHGTRVTIATTSLEEGQDLFPVFDPKKDLQVKQFVAFNVEPTEIRARVPFYMGNFLEFGQCKWALKVKVLWYWPIVRARVGRGKRSSIERYTNCMEASWEPSSEKHV